MGKTGLVYHPAYLEHDMGLGHPESPTRLRAIMQQLEQSGTMARLIRIEPRKAENEWITQVHTSSYVASLAQHAPASGRVSLDPDTSMSPGSLTAAYLARTPELFRIRGALRARLVAERAAVFVGVDAPDFNLGLEAKVKRTGMRTVHFVCPSVWAWRPERIATICRAVHRVLALFPFEPPLYESAGVPVTYVGHPLAADAATASSRREVRDRLRIGHATPVFALLPGSRLSEIDMHAETVLRARR